MSYSISNKNIKEANLKIESLTSELAIANKSIDDLKATVASVDVLKKEHAEKIEALTNENNLKVSALEKTIAETKESVMKEVANKVTAMGIPEAEAHVASTKAKPASKYVITQVK